jgi:pilus assembly protein CpaE
MNIRKLLSGEADVRVVGEASDGLEAIEKFTALTPDVITMCIAMPALDGLSATEEICRKHPWAKVIILSVQDSISYKRRAVLAGACDYLTKPAIGEELKSAIRRAAGRDSFTSEEAATK